MDVPLTPNLMSEPQLPAPQNVPWGDRTFKEVKMRVSGWAPIQSEWCPYKNRKFEHMEEIPEACKHRTKAL